MYLTQEATAATKVVPNHTKWAFSARRVVRSDIHSLSRNVEDALPGDLLLAQVKKLGQHKKLQLSSGRYANIFLDDIVVVCVGDRYAPDQFEGYAEIDPLGCDLVAGGGIAGKVVHAHDLMTSPTKLTPLGLLTDQDGDIINIAAYGLAARSIPQHVTVIGVFGTSMNAGKTTTASSLAHGMMRAGHRVAGIKATGTGAFGDFNAFRDANVPMSDFTDAGMPTTYKMPIERIEEGFSTLVGTAADLGAEIVVAEFADGIFQGETHQVLKQGPIRQRLDGLVFASADAAGAIGSVAVLRDMGHEPLFLSGLVSCSPLAALEASAVTGLPVLTRHQLHDPSIIMKLVGPTRRAVAANRALAA